MSRLPAVRVSLDKKLDVESCKKINDQILGMKGVLGAYFNAKAKEIIVTCDGSIKTKREIRKISGVTGIRHQL